MKRFLMPLVAALAIPTTINANVDPKIAEVCMKAADFKGCVESISGQKNKNSSIKSGYDEALIAFEEGDSLKAMKSIKNAKDIIEQAEGKLLKVISEDEGIKIENFENNK